MLKKVDLGSGPMASKIMDTCVSRLLLSQFLDLTHDSIHDPGSTFLRIILLTIFTVYVKNNIHLPILNTNIIVCTFRFQ